MYNEGVPRVLTWQALIMGLLRQVYNRRGFPLAARRKLTSL